MITGNEPEYPQTEATMHVLNEKARGFTKREVFSGWAMASDDYASNLNYRERAKHWVAKADALIAELNKPQDGK